MKITVSVPFFDPHKNFLPHFIEWYAANKAEYNLNLHFAQRQALHLALQRAVDQARRVNSTHILFVEDDHWGFPVDGLETLLEADKDVIGFQTISRNFPFHSLAMKRTDTSLRIDQKDVANMNPFEYAEGDDVVQKTDLLSWAFTLVKMSVFDEIADPFESWGKVPNDSIFCQHCEDAGIDRYVHFGYCMPHGDVELKTRFMHQRLRQWTNAMEGKGIHAQ